MTPELLHEYDYSFETLLHLRCTVCGGWWTIGDGKIDHPYFCPYCGRQLAPAQYPATPPRSTKPQKAIDL